MKPYFLDCIKVVTKPLNGATARLAGLNRDVREDWCGTGCVSSEYCYGICDNCYEGYCGELLTHGH